ncbi:MAG: M56 family metallopeptidase [Pirellulales bacterium]
MTTWMPFWDSAVDAVAQTILHFVWQGFVLWALAACVLHVARAAAPQTRYAVDCLMLAVLAACPLVTLGIVFERPASLTVIRQSSTAPPGVNATIAMLHRHESTGVPWMGTVTAFAARVEPYRNWLVAIWFAGAAVFASRLLLATVAVTTIKRRRRAIPPELALLVDRLAGQLAFRARPAVYVVDHLSQAMAVGLLKPLVLLPASWLSELPPSVLETVIAHELSHLRRWDLAINGCQRIIECALFFHPVVWWCSRRLRVEREICCDALALGAVGNRTRYAKALTYLADRRVTCADPLVAAGIGGPKMVLLERIRHVPNLTTHGRSPYYGVTCALSGATVASIIWLAAVTMMQAEAAIDSRDVQTATILEPRTEPKVPQRIRTGVNSHERLTGRFKWGEQAPAAIGSDVPSEQHKVTLPDYTIEPPDILFIEASRVVPTTPYNLRYLRGSEMPVIDDLGRYRIRTADVLCVQRDSGIPLGTAGVGPERNEFLVDSAGRVDLGKAFGGSIKVGGLTEDEAREAICKKLDALRHPVTVWLGQSAKLQPITGEHLVGPDGTVNLGSYGRVNVAGMTLDQAKAAIDDHLARSLDNPDVSVSVFAYNSKVYYVITEGAKEGDTVARFPITGSETVLDALTQVNGLGDLSTKRIWIARPTPGSAGIDTVLQVNWHEITKGAATASNYQLLPGDRVFVSDDALKRVDDYIKRAVNALRSEAEY